MNFSVKSFCSSHLIYFQEISFVILYLIYKYIIDIFVNIDVS